MSDERILYAPLRDRLVSADAAAALIQPGETVAMSGFTGSGYPKAVPMALAQRIEAAHLLGDAFQIKLMTGASTAPELDGALAKADGIAMRMPFQSDPDARERINAGTLDYIDIHLSHVAQHVWFGFYGQIDTAVVEVSGIRADGSLVPSTSVGNNKTWLDLAAKVIIEVNDWQPAGLDGMHDIYYGTALPPQRKPIPLLHGDDRIGETSLRCDPDKIVAVVRTHGPDRNSPFAAADANSERIAEHLIDFLRHEVRKGRLPTNLLPLQSGVGNIPNAVLAGLARSGFRELEAFTEVIQDGMLALLRDGVLRYASCTGFALSPEGNEEFKRNIDFYRQRIVMRTQEISNHPELVRRLGCIGMNGMIEADLYGNVNSTHVMGSRIMNGIGGSGDFARNGFLSIFLSPSIAKAGSISSIVPMVSHVDHTEHDVSVIVTEQGLADLRGLTPKQRARQLLDHCVHPRYRDALEDYVARANRDSYGKHTPHLLSESLAWHQRWLDTGDMLG
ncbi:acetyl-CoA hydrolase/transferase family protein [Xanthomonas vesicatoria]|uniref:acetyl-CoA hydrolase/transferase family protein n=1 Tax=Xanthomonas vesicatoria TaxID=56460 RepID=UPI00073240E6|nr:acetyl-CoA hydrolase/transferase family protein [Xanthomonas vesicatoria]KTF38111.1 acetyl-CoA hydrolase [Xanthomonas vesicatoria]MCC8556418.1 acetyl-CoA hydrolase/transferase family protein [Xanthomonas vesicatoria]MCC8600272.1 acetyl-CoA hydrolase/transferase family protein [Xanthomonas vesicatoria]MCC8608397.1 acetyl-CoA hydrolase/transferase family protein [Xanthomonas vesicatoria]MCC8616399.1 acetyl-CoA hydrolase/transferase family protein [Xanthomonas vesicatoria]